jgi:hypothetical protein
MRTSLLAVTFAAALPSASGEPLAAKMRGVCWEAQGRLAADAMAPLRQLGVDWISQTPFGFVAALDAVEVRLADPPAHYWGESDAGLARTARDARALGIRTLLKPHLWSRRGWAGAIRMDSEADWERWFASYEAFILHYADLAEREAIPALAVGTELCGTTGREADWRRLIARVRRAYSGRLTYCANWNEAEQVGFWDALDFVGVQAYYPLGSGERPGLAELRLAWEPIVERLEALSSHTGRPVVFTEVGYRSLAGSLRQPWDTGTDGAADAELQRDAFLVMFESLWDRPWFGGCFVWKWHPDLGSGPPSGRRARDFTPQGKPALEVIRRFYAR